MSTATFTTLVSVLALVAAAGAVGLVVLRLATPGLADRLPAHGTAAAAVVAATCTAGSLWYSEVADFVPCELCWFQRIAMYPLVVLLGVAAVRGDTAARVPASVLAIGGALVSVWHIREQLDPGGASCSLLVPCSAKYADGFGFVTIPVMALAGFALILALLWCAPPSLRRGGAWR